MLGGLKYIQLGPSSTFEFQSVRQMLTRRQWPGIYKILV
jgi:hypothetical protein